MTATIGEEPSKASAARSRGRLLSLFATPAAIIPCPFADEINPVLNTSVVTRMSTNVKDLAFKSETIGNLTDWGDPHVDRLTAWVLRVARTFVESVRHQPLHEAIDRDSETDVTVEPTRSWASIYRRGSHHPAHFHPNTAISAIYYLSSADECTLELVDPRANIDYFDPGIHFANEGRIVRIGARPGELLLLPGWLKHTVPVYEGDDLRISMSWNLGYVYNADVVLRPSGG